MCVVTRRSTVTHIHQEDMVLLMEGTLDVTTNECLAPLIHWAQWGLAASHEIIHARAACVLNGHIFSQILEGTHMVVNM
jgi:hypothetical protein